MFMRDQHALEAMMLEENTAQSSQVVGMASSTTTSNRPVDSGTRHAVASLDCVV